MKRSFWKSDWFAGLAISLLFLFAGGSVILQSFERVAYDWGIQVTTGAAGDQIAVMAIDEQSIASIGQLNANPDVDGAIRSEPLTLAHDDKYYPSLSIRIAAKYLNLQPQDIKARLGEGVKLNTVIDPHLQVNTLTKTGTILAPIIDRMFEKGVEKRYTRGGEIAAGIIVVLIR